MSTKYARFFIRNAIFLRESYGSRSALPVLFQAGLIKPQMYLIACVYGILVM